MGVNKVEFGGETLFDLTGDTVTPQSLLSGYIAHNRAGEQINGEVTVPTKLSELENDEGYGKTIELTQDEYDALGEEKNSDNTLYMIKDGMPSALDNCVLLWENPNPRAAFIPQDITLASDDYDILEIFFAFTTALVTMGSSRLKKEHFGTYLQLIGGGGASYYRGFIYSADLTYKIGNCYKSIYGSNDISDNSSLIPLYIYGYKISGKYPSTSDQNPTQNNIFSCDETRIGTWVDGKPLYRKMFFKDGLANGEGTTNGENASIPTGLSNIEVGYVNIAHSYFLQGNNNDDVYYSFINVPNLPVVIYRKKSNIIQLVCKTNLSAYRAMICFEYTKTTD